MGPRDMVTVTHMCHIVEVQYMEKMNRKSHIKKLDANRYVLLKTGEVKEFEKIQSRDQLQTSLYMTFKKLRYLINGNFTGAGNELHAVLTYAENMQDTERLYVDFKKFMKRLRYRFKDLTTLDYICVVEPQGRGAWHLHTLIRFNDVRNAYIANEELSALWGHGFVNVRSLKKLDNIGAYLTAYLTDLKIDYDNPNDVVKAMQYHRKEAIYKEVDGQTKAFVKGGRLHMYPPQMNLYRASRGIKMPERSRMNYKTAKKIVGPAEPTFQKTYFVKNEEFENLITKEEYNLRRSIIQDDDSNEKKQTERSEKITEGSDKNEADF